MKVFFNICSMCSCFCFPLWNNVSQDLAESVDRLKVWSVGRFSETIRKNVEIICSTDGWMLEFLLLLFWRLVCWWVQCDEPQDPMENVDFSSWLVDRDISSLDFKKWINDRHHSYSVCFWSFFVDIAIVRHCYCRRSSLWFEYFFSSFFLYLLFPLSFSLVWLVSSGYRYLFSRPDIRPESNPVSGAGCRKQ